MKTYQAGKDRVETWGGETRAWVFDLLENPDYRERLEVLSELDLKRRAGCESCLRALVTDDWDYEIAPPPRLVRVVPGREPRARHGHVVQRPAAIPTSARSWSPWSRQSRSPRRSPATACSTAAARQRRRR